MLHGTHSSSGSSDGPPLTVRRFVPHRLCPSLGCIGEFPAVRSIVWPHPAWLEVSDWSAEKELDRGMKMGRKNKGSVGGVRKGGWVWGALSPHKKIPGPKDAYMRKAATKRDRRHAGPGSSEAL
jgi:hypothetical protein